MISEEVKKCNDRIVLVKLKFVCCRRTAVAAYTRASGEIGADVHRQAELVEDLFQSQREFLLSSCGQGRSPSAAGTGPEQANRMKGIKAMATAAQEDRTAHPAHLHVCTYSAVRINVIKGCVSIVLDHVTFYVL